MQVRGVQKVITFSSHECKYDQILNKQLFSHSV